MVRVPSDQVAMGRNGVGRVSGSSIMELIPAMKRRARAPGHVGGGLGVAGGLC